MYEQQLASHSSDQNARDSVFNLVEFNLTIGLNQYLFEVNQSDFWDPSNSHCEVNSLGEAISEFLASNASDVRVHASLLEKVFSNMTHQLKSPTDNL